MTGFFNPQGFATAVQQEISRSKSKNDNWALDAVLIHAEVTDITSADHVRNHPKVGVVGQHYHGSDDFLMIDFHIKSIPFPIQAC
jgi:hypothetical protein